MILRVNGNLIDEISGIKLLPGDVGLWVESLDSGFVEIAFDNFLVRKPILSKNN